MRLSKKKVMTFQQSILDCYEKNGREYIWREYSDPYKILVSEIMLQQTNADKVSPVYQRFTQQYPNIRALAQADLPDLMTVMKPIGLNRARNKISVIMIISQYHLILDFTYQGGMSIVFFLM